MFPMLHAYADYGAASLLLGFAVWLILGRAAWVDARTGRVPDRLMLLGGVLALLALGLAAQAMPEGLRQFAFTVSTALLLGGAIWALNEIWFRLKGHDALGMGDAKWSMVAALLFGPVPVLWGWWVAALLGLGFLAVARLRGRRVARLHFAPFLFAALTLVMLWQQAWPFWR